MAKKEIKEEKIEREYVIPLREKCRPSPRYKKTPKAIKTIKEFLVRHMKIRDRDLNKIKIDRYLNEAVWFRGIKNPPHKIKVKVVKVGDIVRVSPVEFSDKLKFKKIREEKRETKAKEELEKKKSLMQKVKESREAPKEESSEKIEEKKEKSKANEEMTKKIEKSKSKEMKHMQGGKTKEPKRPVRTALEK